MTKYIAISATCKKINEGGGIKSSFANKALTQLAETAKGQPVLINFDTENQIGKIVSGQNDHGQLIIIFETIDHYHIDSEQRLVPGFLVFQDGWNENKDGKKFERIINEVESHAYGLTETPLEKNLPKIKKLKK